MPTLEELVDQFAPAESVGASPATEFDRHLSRWADYEVPDPQYIAANHLDKLSRPAQKFVAESEARQMFEGAGPAARNVWGAAERAGGGFMSTVARGVNAVLPKNLSPFTQAAPDYLNWRAAELERINQEKENAGGNAVVPAFVSRNLRGGLSSLPTAYAGGQWGGMAGSAGLGAAVTANQAVTEGGDAGLKGLPLAGHALAQGAAEGLIPFIPFLGGLEKKFGQGGAQAAKVTLGQLLKEFGSEALQESATSIVQQLEGQVAGTNQPLSLSGWGQLLGDTVAQSAVGVGAVGGIQKGAEIRDAMKPQPISGQEASQALGANPAINPANSASALWKHAPATKPIVEHMLANGMTPEQVRSLATNPSSSQFEQFNLASRKNRTMPSAEARKAWGENALKYLDSLTPEQSNVQPQEAPPAETPADQQVSPTPEPVEQGNPPPDVPAGQVSTPNFELDLKNPPTDLLGQPIKPERPATQPEPIPPQGPQGALFGKEGLPGQQNLFPDKGVPDDMVQKQNREQTIAEIAAQAPLLSKWNDDVAPTDGPIVRMTKASGMQGVADEWARVIGRLPNGELVLYHPATQRRSTIRPEYVEAATEAPEWAKGAAKQTAPPSDKQPPPAPPSGDSEMQVEDVPPPVDVDPIGKTKSFKKIIEYQAARFDMTPKEYAQLAAEIWQAELQQRELRESARKHAAKSLNRNAGNLKLLENQNLDYTKIKAFDSVAKEIAEAYPGLGWQHLVGESSSELEQRLWDLLHAGKDKPPTKISEEYHAKVEAYLNRGGDFTPEMFARMPQGPQQTGNRPDQLVRMSPGAPSVAMKMDAADDGKPGISAQGIVATLAKLFDVPIRSGRVQVRKALGIYQRFQQGIRTKGQSSSDLGVVAHEVAHHLDFTEFIQHKNRRITQPMRKELKALDYAVTEQGKPAEQGRAFEGFAEFVRLYMTMPAHVAKQAAPKFFDYFTTVYLPAKPELATKFEQARQLMEQYRDQGTKARIGAAISDTGQPAEDYQPPLQRLWDRLRAGYHRTVATWKNRGHFYGQLDAAALRAGYKLPEDRMGMSEDMFLALDQGAVPRAERAIDDGVHLVTGSGKTLGPGLKEILAPVAAEYDSEFRYFLVARHALEVYEVSPGVNPGISQADAKWQVEQVAADPEKLARYTKAADGITAFNGQLVDMLVDAGVIAPATAQRLRKYKTYIPLFRAVGDGAGRTKQTMFDPANPARRRHGSGKQILDPIESTMQQAVTFYQAALQKQVALQAIDEATRAPGLAHFIWKVPPNQKLTKVSATDVWQQVVRRLHDLGLASDVMLDPASMRYLDAEFARDIIDIYKPDYSPSPHEQIVRVIRDGQDELYQFHPDFYGSLQSMAPIQIPSYLKIVDAIARFPATATRLFATTLRTVFAGGNAARDWLAYQVQTEHSRGPESLTAPLRWMGIAAASNMASLAGRPEDATVKLYNEMAGQLSTNLGVDRDSLRRYRQKVLANSAAQRVKELLVHPLRTAADVIGVTEVGPRLAEFSGVLRENGYIRNAKGEIVNEQTGKVDRPPMKVLIQAINAANDVTVNFKRSGSLGRMVNRYVPFFNAALEGNSKRLRSLKSMAKGEKNWQRKALALASLASASLVYAMFRVRDDDYEEQEDWLKYGYWTFSYGGQPIIRVPKNLEFSFVPNFIEAMVASIYRGKATPMTAAARAELDRLVPPSMPALGKPVAEGLANKDFFRGKAIDNETLQKLKPEDRYTPQTTELMKAISGYLNDEHLPKTLRNYIGIGPNQLEHFVDSATGNAYHNTYGLGERLVTGKSSGDDLPLIGAFAVKRDYTKSVDDFYSRQAELKEAANSAQMHGKGELAARTALHKFDVYADMMGDLRKLIKDKTGREERFAVEKYIVGLSRDALGEEPLDRYPNPFGGKPLPPAVAQIALKYSGRRQYQPTQKSIVRMATGS